ncbi:MAG TPA: polysaccharide deacetylase family protein [Polyangia bacterium]|nr:polysaccharide deacetylase family protein [Polyangia bacterium]
MKRPVSRVARELVKVYLAKIAADRVFELYRRVRTAASGPRIHVLGYHRVVDRVELDGPVNPALCVSTATLRRQMREVRRRFEVLSLDEAMAAIAGARPLERDACAVTFDDGYYDVLERAHPILAECGIPGAVFVPTGYAGSGRYLTHDRLYAGLWEVARRRERLRGPAWSDRLRPVAEAAERALDAGGPAAAVEALIAAAPASALEAAACALEQQLGPPQLDRGAEVLSPTAIRALADAGWEIGGHTVGHVVLTREPPQRRREELDRSKRELESWSGRPCRYFAYCNGFHDRALVDELRALGYSGAVTTCDRSNRPHGDRMRVSRKVLWEGHALGPDGEFSAPLSAAHLSDLFGTLGLTRPVDGEVHNQEDHA